MIWLKGNATSYSVFSDFATEQISVYGYSVINAIMFEQPTKFGGVLIIPCETKFNDYLVLGEVLGRVLWFLIHDFDFLVKNDLI